MPENTVANTMIYLLGFPGTGKYTIAKEIVAQAGFRLVDNHLINNPIFSLIQTDGKTKLPRMVWDYTDRIWEVVADTMVNLSPPDASFVLTNMLIEGEAGDMAHFGKVSTVAEKRGACLVPVRLDISNVEEHIRRITASDRADRFKETDAGRPQYYAETKKILRPDHPHVLTLDVTTLSASDAAAEILQHARKCGGR